jgi:DNA polymerase-3 subunit delta'
MSLRDVIGQHGAVNMLQNAIRSDRVASAYLFYGLSGTGKRFAAVNFAKALNCLSPIDKNAPDACEKCQSCGKIGAGMHADVITVRPTRRKEDDIKSIWEQEEEETAASGNRAIKIKQVRLLGEALSLASSEGRYKVAILDEAELMNDAAANAFLKTLEEPPPETVIILASSRPEMLPDTINSRCVRVAFKPLGEADMKRLLSGKFEDPLALGTVIRLSMGRPGFALREGKDILKRRSAFFKGLSLMLSGSRTPAWQDRQDMEEFMDHCGLLLRDIMAYRLTGDHGTLLNLDLAHRMEDMGKGAEKDVIIECYERILALRAGLVYNPNKAIVWNCMASVLKKLNLRQRY